AEAARGATAADLAVVRVVERGGFVVRAVAGPGFLAAELEGSRLEGDPPDEEVDELERLPAGAPAGARPAHAEAGLSLPVRIDGTVAASLELLRGGRPFGVDDREAAWVACAQIGLVLRGFAVPGGVAAPWAALELVAEALAAGVDEARIGERVARL